MIIPMSNPDITDAEVTAVSEVLWSGQLSCGPWIRRFEEEFAEYTGGLALAVSSGTAGLHLACLAAGIGQDDEVITTPLSFVASTNCILYCGARPVFVDVDARTLNIDPHLVEGAITPRTVAMLPVHLFHQACEMEWLMAIAKRRHLLVIEDACEALGALRKGKIAGSFGDAGVFAFYPNKQMTTGEGGMVATKNEGWYLRMKSLRNQGRSELSHWLVHPEVGYNYRMDEMSAALGCVQFGRLEELLKKRRQVARWYSEKLPFLPLPYIGAGNVPSWFVYVVRLPPEIDREDLQIFLLKRGIHSRRYFPTLHTQPCYRQLGYKLGDFPIAEEAASKTLALPFSSVMTKGQVCAVCDAIKEYFVC